MTLRSFILVLVFSFMLSSCSPEKFNQTEGNVADVVNTTAKKRNHFIEQMKKPTVQIKEGFYVDTTPIDIKKSPEWLHNQIVLRGEQLPFSYYSRAVAQGAGAAVLPTYQSDLDQTVQFNLNYSGSIRGALDAIASKTGYIYHIDGSNVRWEAFVTKTFDVGFMPGSSDYLMGKTSSDSGAGGGSSSSVSSGSKDYVSSDPSNGEYSNLSGKLSIWKDLEVTLTKMLSDKGRVVVSQSTTSVTVTDRPYYVDMVAKYIESLNSNLAKQVLVKVQILEVQLEDDYNFGINWNNVIKAFHNSKFTLNANYGTPISITAFAPNTANVNGTITNVAPTLGLQQKTTDGIPAYQALINALNQQGKTSIVSEPRVLCLNNQVSAIRIVNEQNYVASIQNTTQNTTGQTSNLTGQTTSQITPGKVTTGLTLYILPKILNDTVFLQVNADISTNVGITSFGSNGSSVQLPQVAMKHFNQRSMIKSGDTLILSGFRQIKNQANQMQLLRSKTLGGQASQQMNNETIILITPIILNGSA